MPWRLLFIDVREPFLILLFDMQTGVSGDMILGALFDLGLDFDVWSARIRRMNIPRLELHTERVSKQGIMATRFSVQAPDEQPHRGLAAIREIVMASELSEAVKSSALAVFARLAEVEGKIHGVTAEDVHFHEVGALDAIVDIVGACLGFEMLGVREFFTTPFTFGTGSVQAAHGRLSVPVPASLALTTGFPSRRTSLPGELCTPTGTALVTTLAKPVPPQWTGILRNQGYGAGTRDIPGVANVLRICLMESAASPAGNQAISNQAFANQVGTAAAPILGGGGSLIYQVECNLDNMVPELIGYASERLFEAGCKDVWQEPIYMKKNRSGIKLCALVEPAELENALTIFAAETSTGGLRYFPARRLIGEKSSVEIETRFGKVEMKRTVFPGRAEARLTPEYESCRKLALAAKVPLQSVYREALQQASQARVRAAEDAGT